MTSLTTSARLRYARAALRQAATLLRDAASLGGGLHEATRSALKVDAALCADMADTVLARGVQCAEDVEAARRARRTRRAA